MMVLANFWWFLSKFFFSTLVHKFWCQKLFFGDFSKMQLIGLTKNSLWNFLSQNVFLILYLISFQVTAKTIFTKCEGSTILKKCSIFIFKVKFHWLGLGSTPLAVEPLELMGFSIFKAQKIRSREYISCIISEWNLIKILVVWWSCCKPYLILSSLE